MYFMTTVVDFFFLLLKTYSFFPLNVHIVAKYISLAHWYVYIDILNNLAYLLAHSVDNLYSSVGDGHTDFIAAACAACGKFALRALAQSLAREYQPQGIHAAHIIVDGKISSPRYVIECFTLRDGEFEIVSVKLPPRVT